jgi:iron(III) transport system permease protein
MAEAMAFERAGARPLRRRAGRLSARGAGLAVVALIFVLVGLPIAFLLYGASRTGSPGVAGAAFTFAHWKAVYVDWEFAEPLLNTLVLGFTVAVLAVIVGMILAWLVARTDMPGRSSLALLLVVPLMISPLITGLAWIALAAPKAGFINSFAVRWLGLSGPVFDIYSFAGITLVMVMHYAPYTYLAVLAALRTMDASMEEAAQALGAGPIRTAFKITLPLIWPAIASSGLLVFIFAAENFSVPTMLGTPIGYETIPSMLYLLLNQAPSSPSKAAALGTLLIWVAFLGTWLQRRQLRKAKRFVTIAGKGSGGQLVRLGSLRYLGLTLCLAYLLFALVLPYLALILGSFMSFVTPRITLKLFTLKNYALAFDPEHLGPLWNTLVLCLGAGFVTVMVGLALSYAIQRILPRRLGAILDYTVIVPNTSPAMVLAIGLLWMFLALPFNIYGTLWVLAIAYFVRFVGYAVRTSGATLMQISPDLEEAARVQGASRLRTFLQITLPLARESVMSIWTLLFILLFLEISATILLYSSNTQTLSVLLWNQLASGRQPPAFAIGVVQSTLIFLILAVTHRAFGTMRHMIDK